MKVEIVNISTKLLMSDILDTNTAYLSRSLREAALQLTCKIIVGNDLEMITDVLQVALRRADVVLTSGGLEYTANEVTRQAVAVVTGRELLSEPPGIANAILLGKPEAHVSGLLIEENNKVIICLPGNRRDMAFLLETEVLPYLHRRLSAKTNREWTLLRTVGIMESSLKQRLADLVLTSKHRITYDSFAGQTNIQLWVEPESDELDSELAQFKQTVLTRLGDYVYGEGDDRLENVVLRALMQSDKRLAIAECDTNHILAQTLGSVPGSHDMILLLPIKTGDELAGYLKMELLKPESDMTAWCRKAAEQLLAQTAVSLGLVVYKNVTQGGMQLLAALASPHGVSVVHRSFGGHPENINQWACTLGLSHLRRWLLANR